MKRCLGCERRFDSGDWTCPACGFAPTTTRGFPAFAAELDPADIGYAASLFERLAEVESRHFWFISRAKLIVWALRRHFPCARSLLELGCGTGNVLASMDGVVPRLVGAEAHATGLVFAARRAPNAELLQMDARRIPYRDEFDVVGAFDLIEHVVEDDRVLREMFAACRPGGGILVTVPQHPWLWSIADRASHHQRRYRRRELLGKLAAVGFIRPWTMSFVSLLLPLLYLLRRRPVGDGADPWPELRIGRPLDRALGIVMTAERRLITSGLSLSAGGSLLAVAHKPECR